MRIIGPPQAVAESSPTTRIAVINKSDLPQQIDEDRLRGALGQYRILLGNGAFITYSLAGGVAMAGMFLLLSAEFGALALVLVLLTVVR